VLGEENVVPLNAQCFEIERRTLLDQRRRIRKRPLPERDDDPNRDSMRWYTAALPGRSSGAAACWD
jgi:hypothetical protein